MTERVYVFRVQRGGRLFWQRGGGALSGSSQETTCSQRGPSGALWNPPGFYNGLYLPRRPGLSKEWVFTRWCRLVVPFTLFSCLQAGCSESASAARESWLKWQEAPRRSKSDCLHSDRWPRMGKSPFYQFVSSFSASWYLFWRQTRLWKAFQRDSTSSVVKMSDTSKRLKGLLAFCGFCSGFPAAQGQ